MAEQKFGVDTDPTPSTNLGSTITTQVAEQVAKINPKVVDQVVSILAERELDKRAEALVKVLDKLADLNKQLAKIRADNIQYDETGKPVGTPTYTKAKVEERKKIVDQIAKHENSINKALGEKKDYSDVYNLAQGKPPKDDTTAKPAGEGGSED